MALGGAATGGGGVGAGGIPVLYTPYLVFPAKKKRQTGFLAPQMGVSSRWGYFINQPFFWAISDSTDATFYANYMTKRGNKMGAEFRYALSETTKGAWMADYLKDRQIDDGTGEWRIGGMQPLALHRSTNMLLALSVLPEP